MSILTDFEADLMRLLHVQYRFLGVYKEFPNQMINDQNHLLVRSIFREVVVEQLHNFIKIRGDLLKNTDFKKLDDVVYPLVKPILDKQTPIKLLRNNYISHVQESGRKFKLMTNEICQKHNLPTSFGYWRFLAGLAFFYIGVVDVNFHHEWNKAEVKYKAMSGFPIMISAGFTMANSATKIGEIMNPLHLALADKGYKTTISRENLDMLRKTYSTKSKS